MAQKKTTIPVTATATATNTSATTILSDRPHSAPSTSRRLGSCSQPKAPSQRPKCSPQDPPLLELPEHSPYQTYRQIPQPLILSASVPTHFRRISPLLSDLDELSISKRKDSDRSASPASKFASPSTSPSILTILHQPRSLDLQKKLALLREEDSSSRLSPLSSSRTLGSRGLDGPSSERSSESKKIPSPLSRVRRKKSVEGTLFKERESHHRMTIGRGLRPEKSPLEDLLREDDSELQFDMDTQFELNGKEPEEEKEKEKMERQDTLKDY